jgi:hypothetical protein
VARRRPRGRPVRQRLAGDRAQGRLLRQQQRASAHPAGGHHELDFYAPGQASGQTFWDRSPVFLVTRTIPVNQQGTFQFARPVLVPSEGAAVILRVVKDGGGPAMLDELELG